MNNSARLHFTISVFFIGMMLSSHSVSLLNNESASLLNYLNTIVHLVCAYFVVPYMVWRGCTSMIKNELSKQSIEESEGGVR